MRLFIRIFACLFIVSAHAQEKLIVTGKSPNLYVKHKVAAGESLNTIAVLYGSTGAQLAKYNGIKGAAVLKKDALLKIPMTRNNLAQGQSPTFNHPVYHVVTKGDNLYRISQLFYNVSVQSLRDWNNLKKDVIKNGQPLIIGYVKGDKSYMPAKTIPAVNNKTVPDTLQAKETVHETHAEAKQPQSVTKTDPKITPSSPVTGNPVTNKPDNAYVPQPGDEGFFAIDYAQHTASATQQFRSGDAATFKTISGWTDRKFYVLMNDVTPGTIVRITSANNKSVCAKVIGSLYETKGAAGLLMRVNNAAASALSITDAKFPVAVTFFE